MRLLANVTSILSLNALGTDNFPSPASNVSPYVPNFRFNDSVSVEVQRVLGRYGAAVFRQLQLTSKIGPTTNPQSLREARLIFSLTRDTLYVDMSETWGRWGHTRVFEQRWLADDNALPPQLIMDVVYADELKKRAGYLGSYEGINLNWPKSLPLGSEQPYYCFLMRGNSPKFVYVGVNDQRVVTSLPGAIQGAEDDGGSTA